MKNFFYRLRRHCGRHLSVSADGGPRPGERETSRSPPASFAEPETPTHALNATDAMPGIIPVPVGSQTSFLPDHLHYTSTSMLLSILTN